MNRKIVIAGGSGFLGRTLSNWFLNQQDEVTILSRRPITELRPKYLVWDGKTVDNRWVQTLREADVLINLAGRSVNCRYTPQNKMEILNSRLDSTRVLGQALKRYRIRPNVWLNMSTATIYTHTYGPPHTEASTNYTPSVEAKDYFSVDVARTWERCFAEIELSETRKIILRSTLVLGNEPGGVYDVFRRLAKLRLGGPAGDGQQYISWIHALDFCRVIDHLIENRTAAGIYNLAAPHPLPNREMQAILRQQLDISVGLPAPRPLLGIGAWLMRTESELVLKSRKVISDRLTPDRFAYRFPTFESAVFDLETARRKKHAFNFNPHSIHNDHGFG